MKLLLAVALIAAAPLAARAQNDAYLDAAARELVAGARARRGTVDLSIDEYRTTSRDRFSVMHRLVGRERLLMRRETAAGVHWRKDGPIDLEITGAREGSAFLGDSVTVPGDLDDYFFLAFDPLNSEFLFRLDTTSFRHPFAANGETYYRFATGDSSSIRLPDGRVVQLRELRVIPRTSAPELIAGSFWLHTETHAVVQATFRPASEYRLSFARSDSSVSMNVGSGNRGSVPFFLKGVWGEVSQITVDYGLWELRWWLPRYVTVAGTLHASALGSLTLEYERRYGAYDVIADTTRARTALADADIPCRGVRRVGDVTVLSAPDSLRASWERKAETRREWRREKPDTAVERCVRQYRVTAPATVEELLTSADLPPTLYSASELISEDEAAAYADRLARLPLPALRIGKAAFEWGHNGIGLLRYNRVEGLSAGVRGTIELGRGDVSAELRYGIADEMPKGIAAFTLQSQTRDYRLSGYRELMPVDNSRPQFTLGNSLRALLLGHDDAFYYRALGAALDIRPASHRPQQYMLRLYAERQAAAQKNTDVSLPHLFDGDYRFRDNITAQRATQYGAELVFERDFGLDLEAFRVGLRSAVRAETGTFEFIRPELLLRLNPPPAGPVALALEAAAGSAFGTAPTQSHWYLGGARTLRGYRVGDAGGEAFWRTRAEVGTSFPIARVSLFTDAGWAGDRDRWQQGRALWSAGAGFSLLDGMLRLDVARALRDPTGWRLHLYLGGIQ